MNRILFTRGKFASLEFIFNFGHVKGADIALDGVHGGEGHANILGILGVGECRHDYLTSSRRETLCLRSVC